MWQSYIGKAIAIIAATYDESKTRNAIENKRGTI
ncbi:hypothetical protein C8J44_2754 [Sphingomonas sp. PP-CE-3A-406]|nr:hypothetical protein C8J44_2754 [Sphingomonas sp. PP-CE-3A-406]